MSEEEKKKARESLEKSAAKIDQTLVLDNNDSISHLAARKMISIVDDHGEKGIVSVKMLPNWSEGATPRDLPSGFRMIFDVKSAPIVVNAYDTNLMYGGTMAVRIPAAQLPASMLKKDVRPADVLSRVHSGVSVSNKNGFDDAYVGIFEHTKRGVSDIERDYWAVTRYVDASLNHDFAAILDAHADKPMSEFLNASAKTRHDAFVKQRQARAAKISEALTAVGVNMSDEDILSSRDNYIDSACYAIDDSQMSSANRAVLYSDGVRLTNTALPSGVIISENMRLGPVILRANKNALVAGQSKINVFPSSTGFTVPLWRAAREAPHMLKFNSAATVASHTWDAKSNDAETHPLLATNAYRARTEQWESLEAKAGFDSSRKIELTPVAVKISAKLNK